MIIPLTDKMNLVTDSNPARHSYCNCVYINDDRKAVIDSGFSEEDLDYFMMQRIDLIINTHFHEDHIINNHRFPNAEIWSHSLDAPAMRSMEVFISYYDITDPGELKLLADFVEAIDLHSCPVHHEITDDEIIDLGRTQLRVIFTPGHSPGHCCFLDEENEILISGDIDLCAFGPWYGSKRCSVDDFINSIRRCMELRPRLVVSAHTDIINEDIIPRFQEYLDIIFQREEKVREALREPHTLDELVALHLYYGNAGRKSPFLHVFEKPAIKQHLDRLIRLNEVRLDGDLYFLR